MIFTVVVLGFGAAFGSRNERFARAFDYTATLAARSIGSTFGVVLAILLIAIYLITTPDGWAYVHVNKVLIATFTELQAAITNYNDR